MANRHRRSHEIELEYAFDRLQATKLEQVFAILVPNQERRIDEPTGLKGESHENSRHLRPCLFGSTEGGEGRVEMWRGSIRFGLLFPSLSFDGALIALP